MITKEMFTRFVKIQASGVCNMVSKDVQVLADITEDEHREILNHYRIYEDLYDIHVEDF